MVTQVASICLGISSLFAAAVHDRSENCPLLQKEGGVFTMGNPKPKSPAIENGEIR
jgi:hypothetical protein